MKYALIVNGVVEQVQPNKQEGFIKVDDSVVCGMVYDGKDTFSNPEKTPEEVQSNINDEALTYLSSTDWYITRFLETGVEVPADITILRADARLAVTPVV